MLWRAGCLRQPLDDGLEFFRGRLQSLTHGPMLRVELGILIAQPRVFLAQLIHDRNQGVGLIGQGG